MPSEEIPKYRNGTKNLPTPLQRSTNPAEPVTAVKKNHNGRSAENRCRLTDSEEYLTAAKHAMSKTAAAIVYTIVPTLGGFSYAKILHSKYPHSITKKLTKNRPAVINKYEATRSVME